MTTYNLVSERVRQNCIMEINSSMGKVVRIEEPKRSRDQNAYYWAVIEIIAKDQAESKDEIHMRLKWSVLGPVYREYHGKTIATVKDSSSLSVKDFSKLLEAALVLAMNLNIKLPHKGDLGWA